MYDESAITRLKQILILRKLNISVKDIKRIFRASDSEVVLEVLGKKAEDIDDEVALLHELKAIVLEFINQIKQSDFHNEIDIKLLYDKAKEIEIQITDTSNRNNVTNVNLRQMVLTYFDDEPDGGYTGKHSFTGKGEMVIASKGSEESDYIGLQTTECFRLPLQMDVVAKSTGEIWLHYNKGGLAINHDTNGSYYLHANDIFTGQHKSYPMKKVPLNDYTNISWVIDYSEANVYINGEHFHTHVWTSSVPFAEKTKIFTPVDVTAGNANTVTVKSVSVTETQITMSGISRLMEVTEGLEDKRLTPPIAINTYRQTLNPVRFIGKKYASGGEAWDNFDWAEGWDSYNSVTDNCFLKSLKIDCTKIYADGNPQDGSALIGLMRHPDGDHKQFEYWIGFFTPENTPVPKGFEYVDFPKTNVGVCWIYGKPDESVGIEPLAYEKLIFEGLEPIDDWWLERYVPNRTNMDKAGYAIIDICFFTK